MYEVTVKLKNGGTTGVNTVVKYHVDSEVLYVEFPSGESYSWPMTRISSYEIKEMS